MTVRSTGNSGARERGRDQSANGCRKLTSDRKLKCFRGEGKC